MRCSSLLPLGLLAASLLLAVGCARSERASKEAPTLSAHVVAPLAERAAAATSRRQRAAELRVALASRADRDPELGSARPGFATPSPRADLASDRDPTLGSSSAPWFLRPVGDVPLTTGTTPVNTFSRPVDGATPIVSPPIHKPRPKPRPPGWRPRPRPRPVVDWGGGCF